MKGSPSCELARCGLDAGCRKESDGSFICICTHDLSQVKPNQTCPRNVINRTHALSPVNRTQFNLQPIGIDQDLFTNFSKSRPSDQATNSNSSPLMLVWTIPATCIVLIIVLLLSIRLVRWVRIYRMTNRSRIPVRFSRNNTDLQQEITPTTNTINKQSLFLMREWIELGEEIGQGCFGKVFRGQLRRPDSSLSTDPSYICVNNEEAVAIKVLKAKSGISLTVAQEELLREAETMAAFSHENILALKGIVFNEFSLGPWIVFEYMALGDLAQLLRSANDDPVIGGYYFDSNELLSIVKQIANGMKYLASRHFIHRDLACRNCLVGERPNQSAEDQSRYIIKISDFGMSRDLHTSDYYKMGGARLLPVRWMSPESILYGKFTLESDVWSFGVVLWEIFSMGALPYYGFSNEQVVKLVVNGNRLQSPISAPPLIRQIMTEDCWKTIPSARTNFSEIDAKLSLATTCSDVIESAGCKAKANNYVVLDYLQPLPDQEI